VTDAIPEGNLIEVYSPAGQRLLPPEISPPEFPWPQSAPVSGPKCSDVKYGGRLFRLLEFPVQIDRPYLILVAGQLDDNRNMMARFTLGLGTAIPAMLVLSALGGYFLSRRVLQPVDQITAALRSINIGSLSQRLPVSGSEDELDRLAETCNQMLERLEDAVDRIHQFTADASHELRSPVALIRAMAEYALRNLRLGPESREAFSEIRDEAVEAGSLLEDMLTLARADAGHGTAAFEPVELQELLEEVCARVRPLADGKKQCVLVETSGPAWVSGDRAGLRRLVSILLDNAIKYTPSQGRIQVGLHVASSRAIVTVTDNGIGIPDALLPRIFDRFARGDLSRGEVSGTGLGLAIAKCIASVHGASISARMREQRGSVFTVNFALASPPTAEN
jgi:signal transduction histidine kinase